MQEHKVHVDDRKVIAPLIRELYLAPSQAAFDTAWNTISPLIRGLQPLFHDYFTTYYIGTAAQPARYVPRMLAPRSL